MNTSILDAMEQSALGVWVATSPSGYYVMLAFHAVGLAALVGSVTVIDLSLLGLVRGINQRAMNGLVKFAWYGLLMNALSGVALFFSEANKAFYSWSFRIKMSLMVLGVISTVILNRTVLLPARRNALTLSQANINFQVFMSLALWTSVIVVGRLMAYLTEFTANS